MITNQNLNFSQDTSAIISDILKACKLEESDEDIIKKISENKPLFGEVIFSAIQKILNNEQEATLYSFLTEQLNTDEKTAITVYKSINEKLIPLVREDTTNKKEYLSNEKPMAMAQKIKTDKIAPQKEPLNKKPDNYREPI